jgi:hypothetical protein
VLIDGRSVGGRARSTTRDGYVLNEGAHALYQSAGGRAVLDALGVRITGERPPAADYEVLWDGEIAPLPTTAGGIATTKLLGARSKLKLGGWFANLAKQVERAGDDSLGQWLEDQRAAADLRKYVIAMCRLTTYSARPDLRPARAMLGQFVAGADGVRYLDGGWQSIVDEVARVARASGATIVEHEPVVALEEEGGRWHVATATRVLDAGSVVFAAGGPSLATSLLGDDPAGWVERAGPPSRAACLDVGGAPGEHQFLLSADEPLYLSEHARVARLAPEGRRLYSLMRYLEHDDHGTSEQNRATLDAHAAAAGLPHGADREVERFLAASVVTWGSPQVGVERPSGLELAGRGAFAAGDWIGRPLLADAAITSGAAVGRAAAQRMRATV